MCIRTGNKVNVTVMKQVGFSNIMKQIYTKKVQFKQPVSLTNI